MKDATYINTLVSHANQGYEIVFTGHSQGASEASIAARALLKLVDKPKVQLILLGSPRPGNKEFANDLMQNIPKIIRFESGTGIKQDLVTQLGMRVWGFHHAGKRFTVPCSSWSLDCHRPYWYYEELERRHPKDDPKYPIIPKWPPRYCVEK